MKYLLPFALAWSCLGQQYTGSDYPRNIDVNGDGETDFRCSFTAEKVREDPDLWSVGFGIWPFTTSRMLRFSPKEIQFPQGELISNQYGIYFFDASIPHFPPSIFYGLGLSAYRSYFVGEWINTVDPGPFDSLLEFVLGVRVVASDGLHNGWLRFHRDTLDARTPFVVSDFAAHPVPGEPIPAGTLPPLPAVTARVSEGALVLSWDARWGPLGLESSPSPVGGLWKALDGTFVGGTTLGVQEEKMFVRLRRP